MASLLETLDGRAVSWSEIAVTANFRGATSLPLIGVKSIKADSKVDRGEKRGASGGRVVARTTGSLTNSGSATFYASELDNLKAILAAAAAEAGFFNGDGHVQLSRIGFDITITHDWADDPTGMYVREYLGCHLDSESVNDAEGNEAKTIDVDINPLQVVAVINGVRTVLL